MDKRPGVGAILGAAGLACLFPAAVPGRAETAAPALAIAALDYIDTSGEIRNQQADHAGRLKAFAESLLSHLTANGKFRVVALIVRPAVPRRQLRRANSSPQPAGPARPMFSSAASTR